MAGRRREPRGAGGLAALAFTLLAVGCGPVGEPRASSPAATPTTSAPSTAVEPRTDPSAARPYVIGVIGDYGIDANPVRQVVKAMGKFNSGRKLDAVVTTGDNAYCCGTAEQAAFAWRMLSPLRLAGAPVYAALGNHDIRTGDGAPVMKQFRMTRRWYTAEVGPVQFLFLDSTRVTNASQLSYVKSVVGKPRPGSFRVVVFHHPGWACSAHPPDANVIKHWLPLFGTKVDLVLAGHNHSYERFTSGSGTPYVTTGGGGAPLYSSAKAACRGAGRIAFLKTAHHAVRLTATKATLRLDAIGVDGAVFDSRVMRPRT